MMLLLTSLSRSTFSGLLAEDWNLFDDVMPLMMVATSLGVFECQGVY